MEKIKCFFLFIIIIFVFESCSGDNIPMDINCIDCLPISNDTTQKALLTIYLTINNDNDSVPISVYKGQYDITNQYNNWILDTFSVEDELDLNLDVNNSYTIKAIYNFDNKKINVIDGNNLRRHTIKDACEADCYIYSGDNIDVSLKFEK